MTFGSLFSPSPVPSPVPNKKTGTPFTKGLENVFTSGLFSDLTVKCKDRTWKAHKVVVCTQSEFFMKACTNGFRETEDNMINLPEEDPEVVDKMLYYCYHFDYKDDTEGGMLPLLLHARLFKLADKYIIESLESLATEKFNIRATSVWNTTEFTEAMLEVYSPAFEVKSSETLRLNILESAKAHGKELFHGPEHAAFREAAVQVPEFLMAYSTDITAKPNRAATLPSLTDINWYRCPGNNCRRHTTVFGVGKNVPQRFHMDCPLRCTKDRDMEWWRTHKTTV